MSCDNSPSNCGCDPCCCPDPVNLQYETLSSSLDNFILNFYGTVTRTIVDGVVVWVLPCDLSKGIPGYPRDPALGTACYFKDILTDLSGRFIGFGTMAEQNSNSVNITGGTISGIVSFAFKDASSGGVYDVSFKTSSSLPLTADRALTFDIADGDRVLKIAGDSAIDQDVSSSAFPKFNSLTLARNQGPGGLVFSTPGILAKTRLAKVPGSVVLANNLWFDSTTNLWHLDDPTLTGTVCTLSLSTFTFWTANASADPVVVTASMTSQVSMDRNGIGALKGKVYYPPVASEDIVNKLYADSIAAGISPQMSVRVASTANLTLSGEQTIDGVLTSGSRILVKNQTTASQNGIYITAAGAWARASDADTAGELSRSRYYFIQLGTSQAGTGWFISTQPTTLGTDPVQFSQFSSTANYSQGSGILLSGTIFSLDPSVAMLRANSLSDVASASTARVNLGLGTIATQNASAVAITGGSFLGATNLAPSTAGARRTIKGNFNLTVNVRDYGAVGDGTTDDTTAINNAIASLTSYSSLYFPSGFYLISGSLTGLANLNHVSIYGDGWSSRIHSNVTGAAGNTFYVATTCSYITFRDLAITGSATVRGSGIHIRLYSGLSRVEHCYFLGCSDFAVHVHNDTGGYNDGTSVISNTINSPLGDGIHFGSASNFVCSNNTIFSSGDDGIGVIADVLAQPPYMGLVSNNLIQSPGSLASSVSGCGIRLADGANDIIVSNNTIQYSREASINLCRFASTTAYCNRISIIGNKTYKSTTIAGPRGALWIQYVNESSVTNNEIYDTSNGSDITYLDFNDLTIRGNTCRGTPFRSISSDDSTTANVRTNWYGLMIVDNIVQWNQANESIYVVPAVGIQINNIVIQGNVGNQLPTGDWIFCGRVATGKITNNTSRDGRSVTTGGLTAVNNN